jgi:hypothetical protein
LKQLGDEVRRELSRFGVVAGLPELVEAWPEAVGETIARNAWPARIARDGTLHVSTADSVCAFELTSRAGEIAARLGVPGLRSIPGRLPEPPVSEREGGRKPVPEPPPAARAEGERVAASIEDENLRKIVARAAALSLARASADRSV